MKTQNKPKAKTEPESPQEATQQPENEKVRTNKGNTNLIAFKRIKANAEQPATTYFLKACTNCKNEFVTENRESETCSDDCQADNRIRGGGRFVFETDLANIPNDFDLEAYPRRNETQTIAQLKKAEEERILQEARQKQEQERAEQQAKRKAEEQKKQKSYEKQLNAFLKNLPESIEEATEKILQRHRVIDIYENEYIILQAVEDCLFFIIAQDTRGNIFATIPYKAIKDVWIDNIKKSINFDETPHIKKILETFTYNFYLSECEIIINGLLEAEIIMHTGEHITDISVFLEGNEALQSVIY